MGSFQTPIVIDGDDDISGRLRFHHSPAVSVSSIASSHTMRADSSECEAEMVSTVDRLSIQPVSPVEAFRTEIRVKESGRNTRKRHNSTEEEDYSNRLRHRPFAFHRGRNELSCQDDVKIIKVIDLLEEEEQCEILRYNKDEDQIIDLDELEVALEDEIFQPARGRTAPSAIGIRNAAVVFPFVELHSYKWNDTSLKAEVSLEAEKTVELRDGSFLMISAVIQNLETDEVTLRGWKLKRARDMGGIVQKKTNEVTFIYEVDLNDPRPCLDQSVVEVELKNVFRVRRLIRTNYAFPSHRFDANHFKYGTEKEAISNVENSGVLVARWKLTTIFDTEQDRLRNPNKPNNYRRCQLESLSDEECSPTFAIEASVRRFNFRDETILGGSGTKSAKVKAESPAGYSRKSKNGKTVISLLDDEDNSDKKYHTTPRQLSKLAPEFQQVYTYGDTFSGGGGSLRGASMAGLKLKYGLDFNPDGCATLRANFPDIKVFQKWAHEFATLPDPSKKFYVDVLHLSPPCQVFSPIHTRPGKDDEMNFASLFAVQALIEKTKPRMVTLEQTFGIMFPKFMSAFNSLVRMFTDNGYSTCWQFVEFHRYGLPQRRKRLIIVAAGPGETLPELPAYTHNEHGSGGLKKYVSVREALNAIPRNASQHDRAAAAVPSRARFYHTWDDTTITSCIMTQGGENNCHPSGRRGLTPREFAALQGFPHEHFFTGKGLVVIKRQIGNAVPPLVAKIIFEGIRKHLERSDAAEQRAQSLKTGCSEIEIKE